MKGGGSNISQQLQPGDRGEAEGGRGCGAPHPHPRDTPSSGLGPSISPRGPSLGLTLRSRGSGRLTLSRAWPREHRSITGHSDRVWEGPGTAGDHRGEGECRSLDLAERPLLHQLHFVLALEPGGGRREQSATSSPSGAEGSRCPPRMAAPGSHLARSRGSIMFLLWKLLNRSRRMLPSGCETRTGTPQRVPGRNPRALTTPQGPVEGVGGVSPAVPLAKAPSLASHTPGAQPGPELMG